MTGRFQLSAHQNRSPHRLIPMLPIRFRPGSENLCPLSSAVLHPRASALPALPKRTPTLPTSSEDQVWHRGEDFDKHPGTRAPGRGGPSGARWLVLNLAVNLLHSTRPAATPIQPEGWVGPPSPGGPRRVPGTGGLLDWPAACWLSRACLRMAWRGLLAGRRSGAERSSPRLCRAHAELLTRGVGPRTRTEHCMPAWFASGFAHSVTDANRP